MTLRYTLGGWEGDRKEVRSPEIKVRIQGHVLTGFCAHDELV